MQPGKYGPRTGDVEAFLAALKNLSLRDWIDVARRLDSFQNKPWGTAMLVTGEQAEKAGLAGVDAVVQTDTIDTVVRLTGNFLYETEMEPEDYVIVSQKWGQATVVAAKALAWRDVMEPDLFRTLWSPFRNKISIPGLVVRGGGCLLALIGF